MHDLHLANQIVKMAKKYAKGRSIKSVSIELGNIIEHNETIQPENLRHNINLLLPEVRINITPVNVQGVWKLKEIEVE